MNPTNKAIITQLSLIPPHSFKDVNTVKRAILRAAGGLQPTKSSLLSTYREMVALGEIKPSQQLEYILQKGHIRSLSGVSIITVLTKPYACPGKCVYCPTESIMPKSYLSNEPAAQRALRNKFDPWLQIINRLCMLEGNGHNCDKIELIVKGGTWNAYRLDYQLWFIRRCFEACNSYISGGINIPSDTVSYSIRDIDPATTFTDVSELELIDAREATTSELLQQYIEEERLGMRKAQHINETAKYRIIGLTLETRPDWIRPHEILAMREMGCTRLEVGLQHTDDAILALIKRGHTVAQFKEGIRLVRDAGFKVDFHTMPDLPGATPDGDINMYKQIFEDPELRPDMIKIYPCAVVPLSELHDWYLQGKFTPYSEQELYRVLKSAKLLTPRYCRISRLIRDIPSDSITAGNSITNLRETLQRDMKKDGHECVCLRCREYGRQIKFHPHLVSALPQLFIEKYQASTGYEYFLSYEDAERVSVSAFLRLRLPTSQDERVTALLPEINGCAFIRELHTYGNIVPIDEHAEKNDAQHRGLGKKLMIEAEKIARSEGFTRVAVISGVGVREYYRKLGYELEGTYMIKDCKKEL